MQTIVSQKHKVVGVQATEQIINLFPNGKRHRFMDMDYLLVPHGETEVYLLRKIGLDVPAPILTQYNFPMLVPGENAFEVQKKTCALMTMAQRAYVLNGLGTGKTKCAIWSYLYLKSQGRANKMLVIAPISTLTFVWLREAFEVDTSLKINVLYGDRKTRLKRLAEEADIYVINHDGIGVIAKELALRKDIDTLCIDELAKYRNKSNRTTAVVTLAGNMQWVWGMTGAPMPHEATDVFWQCKVITPGTVPKYFSHFRAELMYPLGHVQKWVPKPDAVEKAYDVMQPAVRFTIDDVQELPPCIERFVDVEMGKLQDKVYKDIVRHCQAAFATGELVTAANAGAAMSKLLQISLGWVYTSDGKTKALDNLKRIEALVDAIESTDRKVLVFVPYIHALDGIAAALTVEKIDHAVVSGATAAKERNRIFSLFQNTGKFGVLVAHPECVAHGITLTAADTVVWFGPITSLEIYDQANHRIKRVGQKHKQQIIHLQSTPVEKRVYNMLRTKQNVQQKFLEMFADTNEVW